MKNHILVFYILLVLMPTISTCSEIEEYDQIRRPKYSIASPPQNEEASNITKKGKKEWTFITYMAADNDLAHFSRRNLAQQAEIGSNDYINIVTQLDTRAPGSKKITKRYYVEKDRLLITNQNDPHSQKMDSGHPDTLISCCKWAIENYPAHHYALIFWNHGTGIIDIGKPRIINPSELFSFNPANNLIELNRSIPFLEYLNQQAQQRGVCFDDSTGHYLTNQNLEYALKTICTKFLKGKKLDLIGFDCCLMSMIEVADIVKDFAQIMVSSQEVELVSDWNYQLALDQFLYGVPNPIELATQICTAFKDVYGRITNDFTQSALHLHLVPEITSNINTVAQLLLSCVKLQQGTSIKDSIKTSRHKLLCTHFDEPSYIDLHHFYCNLLSNLDRFKFTDEQKGAHLVSDLKTTLQSGCSLITNTVFANVTGKNLKNAQGISIYFPERRIHNSYRNTNFVKQCAWMSFLSTYLSL